MRAVTPQALAVPVAGLLLAGTVTVAAPAAASAATTATSTTSAYLRTAHLSPDTPGVDLYLTSAGRTTPTIVRNETYGHFSRYLSVAPGTYSIATRLAGAASTSKALVTWRITLKSGDAYTAAVLGSGSSRRGTILRDDLTAPAKGQARVRLIQAASNAPVADITANGNVPVAQNAAFASATGYVSLPAGTWPLTAQSTSSAASKVATSISLTSGSVISLVLLNKPGGGLTLTSALDSVGSAVSPVSGINTGGGFLAQGSGHEGGSGDVRAAALGSAALAIAGAFLLVVRRRSQHQ